jgi:hypothetical protein
MGDKMIIETKAIFTRKEPDILAKDCVVDKVIRLSGAEFDRFSQNLLKSWDFLIENQIETIVDEQGRCHCLLIMGEGRRDGILVNTEGYNYARYSAFIPNAEDLLTVGRYPALTDLNKKLVEMVDYIIENAEYRHPNGLQYGVFGLYDLGVALGTDLSTHSTMRSTLIAMLNQRPDIEDAFYDERELVVYLAATEPEQERGTDDLPLANPDVTLLDMYAYGYSHDGMIPVGKERALLLYDRDYQVYKLFENDNEGVANCREDIESHGGLFGVENTAYRDSLDREHTGETSEQPFQVFILNRERYDKVKQHDNNHDKADKNFGEWLTLPAEASDLQELFERIGITRPSESAFTITAIRLPMPELLRNYIGKYDSLDELNYLATLMGNIKGKDYNKLQAILSSDFTEIIKRRTGISSIIILVNPANFDKFVLWDVRDKEQLGQYFADDKADDLMSYEIFGAEILDNTGGSFTEWGFISLGFEIPSDGSAPYDMKELSSVTWSTVPENCKIVRPALDGLRPNNPQRTQTERVSVVEQLRSARNNPQTQSTPQSRKPNKNKGANEL